MEVGREEVEVGLAVVDAGDVRVVEELIARGLDPNACDSAGYSLLHIAAGRGHQAMVEALLVGGAKVDVRDGVGHTPLHLAVIEDNAECAKVLIEHGADTNARNEERMVVMEQLVPIFIVGNRSPLHYAAEHGSLSSARLLIDAGADLEAKDNDGYTPFHLASLHRRDDLAKLLNPCPSSEVLFPSPEEYEWRWHEDYRKRSVRAAKQYQHILDGPCCYPCRYLERFLDHPATSSS